MAGAGRGGASFPGAVILTLAGGFRFGAATGTLCNITCANGHIESGPRNDALIRAARSADPYRTPGWWAAAC